MSALFKKEALSDPCENQVTRHESQHRKKCGAPAFLGCPQILDHHGDDRCSSENSDYRDFYRCVHDPLLGLDRNLGRAPRHSSSAAFFSAQRLTRVNPRSPAAFSVPRGASCPS